MNAAAMNSSDFTPIIVTTTCDDRTILEKISYHLIESKLAACVQISGPIHSCYHWEGKVETAEEWSCAIKTSLEKFQQLQDAILKHHSYDEPQLLAIAVTKVSDGYLDWMRDSMTSLP